MNWSNRYVSSSFAKSLEPTPQSAACTVLPVCPLQYLTLLCSFGPINKAICQILETQNVDVFKVFFGSCSKLLILHRSSSEVELLKKRDLNTALYNVFNFALQVKAVFGLYGGNIRLSNDAEGKEGRFIYIYIYT